MKTVDTYSNTDLLNIQFKLIFPMKIIVKSYLI